MVTDIINVHRVRVKYLKLFFLMQMARRFVEKGGFKPNGNQIQEVLTLTTLTLMFFLCFNMR